ncbi:uncharacterized protein LOC128554336 [Mercenaria mercenaria]|uniref:uncharacterized protein LOC128554336 n=1 Tax=Mercenaria mercenaria TaxID=6596 RepID=UPI00234E9EC3|nr:uncharacterized protein LOC128554336 [Mercenaria mercenaria]XP_053391586.1 uncharacterized protein LOC128554336 [Mercenaria mercenaria]XP_053391587.1 uncharacterized protein LOC128554336 [Mercenaria mercenaria]
MSGENPPEQRLSGKLPASLLERFDKQLKFPVPKQKPKILPKPVIPSNRITQVPTETTMSDNSIFHSPMILVLTVDGKATCNQSTLDKLREIEKPLNIVSVVGTLRTGKSFILNKLARHDSGTCHINGFAHNFMYITYLPVVTVTFDMK